MNDKEKDKKPVVGAKPLVPPRTGPTPAPLPMWSGSVGDKLAGLPMFRGAAQKPNSLFGRLKNLKTKDVAFIGAGLAVLVMAPLAEYLVSESGDESGRLTQGFDQKGDFFQQGGGPSEPGILGLARGGLLGENPDVITPLNARDPSSLIMAAGGERQEAPVAAPAPEVKRDAPKDSVWDKVVSSAKSGATTAAKKVGLPKPNVKLSGALNGLRSLSGGSTGAKLALAAPDSKGLFSSPRRESHLAPTQAAPGYRGAGQRGVAVGHGGGGFDGRSPGAGGAGGATAGDVMGGGVGSGGRGAGGGWAGDGEATKNPGGSSTKDNKALGENLEFLRRKMEMEKAIDLKWAKKRYDELERKKMVEQTLVQTAQQAFLKVLDKLLEGKKDGGGGSGGGSGGGGSPGGGKPEAGNPPNEAGTPAGATPSGLRRVASVGKVDRPDSAPKQLAASQAKTSEAGGTLDALGKNGSELAAKAAALETGDDRFKAIAKHVRAAAQDVEGARKALAEDLKKAEQPFKDHEAVIKDMTAKLKDLDSSEKKAGEAKTAIDAELGKLKKPEWKENEKYDKGGADGSQLETKAQDALTAAQAAKRDRKGAEMPSDAAANAADAAKSIQSRGAEVGKILADMMASAPAEMKPALAKAQQDLPGLFNDAAGNVQVAAKNVEIAFDAARESGFRVNQVQLTYELAQEAAVKASEKAKTVAGTANTAITGYDGYTLVGGKGPAKNDAPFTAANDAKTAAQGLQTPISDLQKQVQRTRQRLQ